MWVGESNYLRTILMGEVVRTRRRLFLFQGRLAPCTFGIVVALVDADGMRVHLQSISFPLRFGVSIAHHSHSTGLLQAASVRLA
jgi:hypothetical protein